MIAHFKSNKYSLFTALVISLLLVSGRISQLRTSQVKPISWDVYGYYLYLPSTFIYHDIGLEQREWIEKTRKQYEPCPFLYQIAPGKDGKQVNVYPMGLACIYAPGFFVAHAYAHLFRYPADGFSAPYQWSLIITAILFVCLGVFLLRTLLLKFFPDKLSAALLVITILSTNYLAQAGFEGTMPHNFMFVFNCLILLCTISWHESFRPQYAIFLALLIGWATISRPTELIWILVPLFWGIKNKESFFLKMKLLRQNYKQVILFASTLILSGLPQLVYWKWTTGHWFSYNHQEAFSFLAPYTAEFLFSYKKGWLVYTPVMLFSLWGLFQLFKRRKDIFYAVTIFLIINIYVLSSWENWWYAASFGQRPMVESYPLLAIPLGFFLIGVWQRRRIIRLFVAGALGFCLILNVFQTWQLLNYMIDPELMTKAYYWKIFGKTYLDGQDKALLEIDRNSSFDESNQESEGKYYKMELVNLGFEKKEENINEQYVDTSRGYNSAHCLRMDSLNCYCTGIKVKYYDLTNKPYIWVKASAKVFPLEGSDVSNSGIVISVESKGRFIKYITKTLSDIHAVPGQWNDLIFYYLTPYILHDDDQVTVVYWNMGKKDVFIDDFKITALIPKL